MARGRHPPPRPAFQTRQAERRLHPLRLTHHVRTSLQTLEHQHTIVEKLLALEEETQRLARLYERKLSALEELKKSLLHEAFAGEL